MAKSGDFDAVFYGHSHKKHIDKVNDCIIVNPGEISSHRTSTASFAIYDTTKNDVEIIELENIICVNTEDAKKYRNEKQIKPPNSKTHEY